MIVECALASVPCAGASGNVFNFQTIAQGVAVAAGDITYFRMKETGGDVVLQGTCSLTSADIVFDDLSFSVSDTCDVTSIAVTVTCV